MNSQALRALDRVLPPAVLHRGLRALDRLWPPAAGDPPRAMEVTSDGFGNCLAFYFGGIAWYFLRGQDARVSLKGSGPNAHTFPKLPRVVPYDPALHEALLAMPGVAENIATGIFRLADWSHNRGLLRALAPLVRKTLQDALAHRGRVDSPSADVVIHFRCGDTPLDRHPEYLFQRHRWYLDALERASRLLGRDLGRLVVLVLSCTDWHALGARQQRQARVCGAVLEDLIARFRVGRVEVHCGAVLDDFVAMMRAPCLLTTGSSLSYMAGLAADNHVISPDFLHAGRPPLRAGWWVTPSLEVRHEEVPDYDDVPFLLEKLRA